MTVSAHRRPLRIDAATLIVRDLDTMRRFYEEILGLTSHNEAAGRVELGAPDAPFLTLIENRAAPVRRRDGQGLFHIAYLMPTRADLAAWAAHVRGRPIGRLGASDHGVSEALYIDDPEGNGIEIYADRADDDWPRSADGAVLMTTERLDLEALRAEAPVWRGAPEGLRIGHVHLQVDDPSRAAARYAARFTVEPVVTTPDAIWLGAGGYHHHIAVNSWRSRGAASAPSEENGLAELRLSAAPEVYTQIAAADGARASDDASAVVFDDPAARRIVVSRSPAA